MKIEKTGGIKGCEKEYEVHDNIIEQKGYLFLMPQCS
jgi:hypothetical protein